MHSCREVDLRLEDLLLELADVSCLLYVYEFNRRTYLLEASSSSRHNHQVVLLIVSKKFLLPFRACLPWPKYDMWEISARFRLLQARMSVNIGLAGIVLFMLSCCCCSREVVVKLQVCPEAQLLTIADAQI